ncbi:hypothetical protein ABLT31_34070, partial [Ammoniphilus sp. 3BR4]
ILCGAALVLRCMMTNGILLCLHNENIVNHMQEKFKRRSRFRVIPSKIDGELKFVLAEKRKASK